MAESSNFSAPSVPKFDGDYDHWSLIMENLLRSKEYWSVIESGIKEPKENEEITATQQKALDEEKLKDLKAKNYLFQAIDKSILKTITQSLQSLIVDSDEESDIEIEVGNAENHEHTLQNVEPQHEEQQNVEPQHEEQQHKERPIRERRAPSRLQDYESGEGLSEEEQEQRFALYALRRFTLVLEAEFCFGLSSGFKNKIGLEMDNGYGFGLKNGF
ncbi:hypothetical protein KIW84_072479 [Lathyrus oleraceus]|uniref:DUF4219 domain-containing protein n=1 Tax=Pisum sativum TaxID=3888 RepID=A0A9D4VN53_PEA|nr:hypothetical protein KIW84_072479 [Pisum sativum]